MTHSLLDDLRTLEKSQNNPDVQLKPGSFNLITAWINYGQGLEYPISDKILKVYVHEDMESVGLGGWIELIDTANLIRNGPIVGQELLYIKFETAGATESGLEKFAVDFTKQPLWIHEVEGIKELKTASGGKAPQALTYRLHFCSPELLRNDRIKISQTMQGSYSDIVKQILKNNLKTTKTIEFEETTDLKHIVVPDMRPLDAIDWLTLRAEIVHPNNTINPFKGRAADFYFYETTRGYKFLPAMNEATHEITLTLGGSNIDVQSYMYQMLAATDYEYGTTATTLSTIPSGLWGSKKIVHDHFNKSVKKYQSSYHKALIKEQTAWANKTPVFAPTDFVEKNRDDEDKMISDFPDSTIMFDSVGGKTISTVNKNTAKINYPWSITPPDLSMRSLMQRGHACNYNLITIRVHGISALETGMVVKLDLPDVGTGSGQYDGGDYIFYNRSNNNWIIRQLTHVIDNTAGNNNYYCDMIISNTLRDTPQKGTLPSALKMGSGKARFKTPTTPTFNPR